MLMRIVASKRDRRHERRQPISRFGDLGGHLQLARADWPSVLSRSINQQLICHRLRITAAAAGWQECITVAVAAGTVDIERRARIDPNLQSVAIFQPPFSAPYGLLFAIDF